MPSQAWPKVKRSSTLTAAGPTVLRNMPNTPAKIPLIIAPPLNAATIATPNMAIAAISAKPNARTKGEITGMISARDIAPTTPPIAGHCIDGPERMRRLPSLGQLVAFEERNLSRPARNPQQDRRDRVQRIVDPRQHRQDRDANHRIAY